MTDWGPATEAETAMRDALRAADQELYFRILARTELLLPVSSEALAGRAPMGWGTWNSGGRTHVLAFTSAESMRACLAEHAGSARRIAYHELADAWPNHEWWLAVNPGLPIEGYLPPWFVTQLARGDVRMPGRTTGVRSRAYATTPADSSANDIGVEQTFQPFGGRTQSPFPRGAGAAAATGARREAARATATAARDAFTPTPPPPPDEPIEAEMVDADSMSVRSAGAHSAGRSVTASGLPAGPSRRPRRHDATIIDAEIIESTVLGMTALDAMVVNATVIDASTFDSDIIDATLIDLSVEDTGARAARYATDRHTGRPHRGAVGRRRGTNTVRSSASVRRHRVAACRSGRGRRQRRVADPPDQPAIHTAGGCHATHRSPCRRGGVGPRRKRRRAAPAQTAPGADATRRRIDPRIDPRPRRARAPLRRRADQRPTLRSGSMRALGPTRRRPMRRSASIRPRPRQRARPPERRATRRRMRRSGSIRGVARTPRRRDRSTCVRARRRRRTRRSGSIRGRRRRRGPRPTRRGVRRLRRDAADRSRRRPVADASHRYPAARRVVDVAPARIRRPRRPPG